MEIHIAKMAGFCFGVKRAVEIAFETATTAPDRKVGTLGPIIHNPQVINRLKESGVLPLSEDAEGVGDFDTIIIRTHGIPAGLFDSLKERKFDLIDATCPFVKKAQQYAKLLKEEGYQVLILGDGNHPEVKGILSYAGAGALVVGSDEELPGLKDRVGVVVQTTQPVDALKRLLNSIVETSREIKVYNTICSFTALRLRETEELAGKVDIMVVVGGKNSANTRQLTTLCRRIGVETHHIETTGELSPSWFKGINKVGITAGASTPEWIIKEVLERIENFHE